MSSTKRGGQRSAADYYPTPGWCVERLLEAVRLPGGVWLEPTAGDGAIVRAANASRFRHALPAVEWHAVELEARHEPALRSAAGANVRIGSFLDYIPPARIGIDVVILNPPFRIATDVIERALSFRPKLVVALLRLNYLGSERRADWMRSNAPDVHVLPNRPVFDGRGGDSVEYGWFVWFGGATRSAGVVSVLASTPREQRARPGADRHRSSRSSRTATRSAASG